MTQGQTELTGDVLITGYTGKLRVARDQKGFLQYEEITRKTQAPEEREWEHVVDNWSGGMGLARLPAGQLRTKRYYYSKNFDPTAPGILRPAPAMNSLTLSVAPGAASAVRNGFEERIGSKDYVYLLLSRDDTGYGSMIAKIDNSGATPSVIEIALYGTASTPGGQPAKAYSADESEEIWHVPISNANILEWSLDDISDPATLTSEDTERSNFAPPEGGRWLHGTQTAVAGPLNWTVSAARGWAALGADFNPSGGSPPTVDTDTIVTDSGYFLHTEKLTLSDFNTGSGSDKCLIVCVVRIDPYDASGITFDGNPLTETGKASLADKATAQMFHLTGVSGTHDIVITALGDGGLSVTAFVLNGVHQAAPNTGNDAVTSISTTPSCNPTLGANDLGVAVVSVIDRDEWGYTTEVGDGSRHFQRVGPIIWRADMKGRVQAYAIGPTNDFEDIANWGTRHPVGQSDTQITGLATMGRSLYVAKPEGLFGVDENGEQIDMIPEIDADANAKFAKGFGTTCWHGRLWYPAGNQGAWYHDLAFHKDIGPDSMMENLGDEPNLSNQIRFGWHAGFRPTAKWLYNLYAPDASNLYVMIAREREDNDEVPHSYHVVWHPIFFLSSSLTTPAEASVFISHRGHQPRMWFLASTASVSYVDLAADGSLYEPDGDRGTSVVSQIWEAETDLGFPGTLKYLREAEAILEDGDANAVWSLHYHHDGSVQRALGASFTASGSTQRFVTPGTNDTFRRIRFMEQCSTAAGGLTNEAVSLRRVVYRGGYLPDTGFVVRYTFDIGVDVADSEGVFDERTVEEKTAALKALLMGQVRTLTDHRGEDRYVVVEDVQATSPQSHDLKPGRSYVAVTMAEVEYS